MFDRTPSLCTDGTEALVVGRSTYPGTGAIQSTYTIHIDLYSHPPNFLLLSSLIHLSPRLESTMSSEENTKPVNVDPRWYVPQIQDRL